MREKIEKIRRRFEWRTLNEKRPNMTAVVFLKSPAKYFYEFRILSRKWFIKSETKKHKSDLSWGFFAPFRSNREGQLTHQHDTIKVEQTWPLNMFTFKFKFRHETTGKMWKFNGTSFRWLKNSQIFNVGQFLRFLCFSRMKRKFGRLLIDDEVSEIW